MVWLGFLAVSVLWFGKSLASRHLWPTLPLPAEVDLVAPSSLPMPGKGYLWVAHAPSCHPRRGGSCLPVLSLGWELAEHSLVTRVLGHPLSLGLATSLLSHLLSGPKAQPGGMRHHRFTSFLSSGWEVAALTHLRLPATSQDPKSMQPHQALPCTPYISVLG